MHILKKHIYNADRFVLWLAKIDSGQSSSKKRGFPIK